MDPRLAVIPERLRGVSRIAVFCSGKGGVGKTLLASLAALIAVRREMRVGLLDLDFNGPSSHVVLGASGASPREEKGLVPPEVSGVKLMSLALFASEAPLPLRGADATDALLELLAVTRWGDLDLLVVDAPPGTGDELLDAIRFLKRGEAVVVTTPSKLSLSVVARLVRLLKDVGTPLLGLVENMGGGEVKAVAAEWGVRYLGWIPYDPAVEKALGNPDKLLDTEVASRLERALLAAGLLR